MSDGRKKTFVLGAMIKADSVEEAWDIAIGHLPADFTPEQGQRAAEAGVVNFSIAEMARFVSAEFVNPTDEEITS